MNTDLITFLQAWTGGADVSDAERQRLLQRLQTDTNFRAECAEEIWLLGMIKAVQTPPPRWLGIADALGLSTETMADPGTSDFATQIMDRVRQQKPKLQSSRSRWLSWRPLAAAAVGIVLGMFCTSVVFAYMRPTWESTMTLLKESFESGEAPLVTGVPTVPDRWGGDYSEVVETLQGVKPLGEKKMLRLLRADYEGKPRAEGSRIADLYRLIDMRPYREQFADGGAVVQFSAAFNAAVFAEGENYLCRMSLHAFDSQTAAGGRLQDEAVREENELAEAKAGRIKLDRDPATWQRVSGDLRLPANTDFLVVHVKVHHTRGTSPQATFPGHFLDDVRLTMSRRAPSR